MAFKISYLNKAIIFLTLLAACFIQVQSDFLETPFYAGLRLSLADVLLPVSGILICISLYLKQSEWPVYKIPNTYLWFAVMTAVLLFSLYTGFVHQGVLPEWGLHNKILGWFVLLAYFLWGAWLAYNGKSIKIYKFFRTFVIFALIVGTIGSIIITLQDFNILAGVIAYPYKGLMANRNALGLLFLSVTILMFFYGQTAKPLLGKWDGRFFWFILPLIHVQIGSRSCWIIMILQMIAFLFINRTFLLKKIAPFFMTGCALVLALSAIHTNFVFKQRQDVQFIQLPSLLSAFIGPESNAKATAITNFPSDLLRLKVNGLALELWASSPIFGTGLGTTQFEEPKKFGAFLDVVDSTPVWILAETGIVGAVIFAAFFWLIFFYLARELKSPNKHIQTVNSIALGIFLTFAIMSLMHELLYTRFLWFILGIAITVPAATLRMHQASINQATN